MDIVWVALIAAMVLAGVHLAAGRLRFLDVVPRSRWLSLAGGVSVAYVFVHLLPELEQAQAALDETATGVLPALEHHAYLMALLGLSLFYGLERRSHSSRRLRRAQGGEDATSSGIAWVSIASYATYNALIGYLLVHREEGGVLELALFSLALGVHFVVNDKALREHHQELYHRYGRWVCSGAVLAGWAVGAATRISEPAIALLLAFLAGGIVLNVLKEELPTERESRFGAFALGAAGYAALLLAV